MKLTDNKFRAINIFLSILFSITQILVVLGLDAGFNPYDTPSYFEFDLIDPTRLPVITFIFTLFKYFDFIVIMQIFLSVFSWLYCIYSLQIIFKENYQKLLICILIIILSLTTPILEQQSILMSESITISFITLAFSSLVRFLFLNKITHLLIFLSFLIMYSGTKVSNSYISLLFLILFLIYLLIINMKKKILIALSIIIASIPIYFFIDIGSKSKVTLNLVSITNIIERTFDDSKMREWYRGKGFPADAYNAYTMPNNEPPIENVIKLPQIKMWLNNQKYNVQILYLIENPIYTLIAPMAPYIFIDGFSKFESIYPPISMGTINHNNTHLFSNLNAITMDREPDYLRALKSNKLPFWDTNKISFTIIPAILFLVILICYVHSKNRNLEIVNQIIVSFIIFIFIGIWLNWHFTVNYDMQRFLLPYSVLLRILFCICIVALFSTMKLCLDNQIKRDAFRKNSLYPRTK